MDKIFIFVDDSGKLHKNANDDYFIYAGYIFLNNEEKEKAKRKYRSLNKKIGKSLQRTNELKGCNLSKSNKRALFNVMRDCYSFHVMVYIPKVYEDQKTNKKTIVRFQDYALKRIIKRVFEQMIKQELLNPYDDIKLYVNIDQQLTSTDGFYTLDQSIYEELVNGISGFDYSRPRSPIWYGNMDIELKYCESENDYLIQASDILANRIFTSYRDNKPNRREIKNHIYLTLP